MAKQMNDPVHGQIQIDEDALKIIEHKQFQRLRRVKALGFLDRVFPSAKHSRFEHSIGAYHVSKMLMKSICERTRSLTKSQWSHSTEFVALELEDIDNIFTEELTNC